MAFYSEFKNLTTGLTLNSMSEFASIAVGTQLEKASGEVYEKASDGTLFKVVQNFYNKSQANSLFVNATGDTMSGSLLAATNLAYDIGSTSNKFNNVYGNYFSGTSEFANNVTLGGTTYQPSTSAVANTLALRDANADITATNFRGLATNATNAYNIYYNSITYVPRTSATNNSVALRNSSGNLYANTFYGTATSAQYADLAEKYLSDAEYDVGTVVEIGGDAEITEYNGGALAGVISGQPGFQLNSESDGQFVALKGKVPVFCEGDITKGQYCVAINGGKVKGYNKSDIIESQHFDIVGVALEDSKDGQVVVKV
jgi:hypothetical protein